jgi:uridine kinase
MSESTTAHTVIQNLVDRILAISFPHPVRVGINGVDGSGKTVFAKQLVDALRAKTNRQIVVASIDNFHNPKTIRHQRGSDSAEGFYEDSFQYEKLKTVLLDPLAKNGNRQYRTALFNVQTNQPVDQEEQTAQDGAILIVEGIFLFRPDLAECFDFKIYLDVPFEETLARMLERDTADAHAVEKTIQRFHKRYKAGQEIYINTIHPKEMCNVVIDNTNFDQPKIV